MNRLKYLLLYRWRNRDALTGSFDIHRFHRDFDSTLHTSNRVALIVADVDDMKSVNDTYGVEFGDAVLRRIAKALMTRCRATGTLGPYRIGEAFDFIQARDVEKGPEIAELLREDVENLRFDAHPKFRVTIRLAVAIAPADGKTFEELWRKVGKIVYGERRRNQVLMN